MHSDYEIRNVHRVGQYRGITFNGVLQSACGFPTGMCLFLNVCVCLCDSAFGGSLCIAVLVS